MILYHGTNVDFDQIELANCKPFRDFGKGFYLTKLKKQAERMALRTTRINGGTPIVISYSFNETYYSGLNVMSFPSQPSLEWALFITNNRNRQNPYPHDSNCNLDCKYDIVIGPVADDDIAELLREYSSGNINIQDLKNGLTYKELTNQYSFHTQRAINLLKKEAVEICRKQTF